MIWALGFFVALAMGSIPFGLIIGRLKGIDVRAGGSGNIGATNVGRLLGTRWFFVCFFLDLFKGLVPTLGVGLASGWAGELIVPNDIALSWLAVMVAPVLGHMFSPFVGFRGGKGVATGVGAMIGVFPIMTLPAVGGLVVFLGILGLWRYISAASCAAAVSIPIWVYVEFRLFEDAEMVVGWVGTGWPFLLVSVVIAGLVIFKHRSNLGRLMRGTEPKIRSRGADTAQS